MKWVLLVFAITSQSVPGYSGSGLSMREITSMTTARFEDQASCENAAKTLTASAKSQIDGQYGNITALCVPGGKTP